MPHVPENIIDVGDNCKQANTSAMKVAINRLCHVGDDVYGKRVEEEGAGSKEDFEAVVLKEGSNSEQSKVFRERASKLGFTKPSAICEALGIEKLSEITDFGAAIKKLEGGDKP
jgi:hypothetical protein